APLLEGLISADFPALVVNLAVGCLHLLVEHIVQAFGAEITFLIGHPLLQAEVRLNDELAHGGFLNVKGGGSCRLSSIPSPGVRRAAAAERRVARESF